MASGIPLTFLSPNWLISGLIRAYRLQHNIHYAFGLSGLRQIFGLDGAKAFSLDIHMNMRAYIVVLTREIAFKRVSTLRIGIYGRPVRVIIFAIGIGQPENDF